jgi:uncharacterized membrane protein YagU involved in acid resistance
MKHRIQQSLLAGLVATVAMTMVTLVAPLMGFPPMNPPQMLAGMMGFPLAIGWVMHFMIGVIFALAYTFLFRDRVAIANRIVKGIAFGLAVFVFALIMMVALSALMGPMAEPQGSLLLLLVGGAMGHMIYGLVVGLLARSATASAA